MSWKAIAAEMLIMGAKGLSRGIKNEGSKIKEIFKSIYRYPIKLLATYILSPFLIILIVKNSKLSTPKRIIAMLGVTISIIAGYASFTFLGTFGGSIFIASQIGILSGFGFLLGTLFSVYLTVIFCILLINFFCTIFLKLSSDDVVHYLESLVSQKKIS